MMFETSFASGKRLEDEIELVCKSQSRYVATNVIVPTLHTEHGYTEVDVLLAIGNVLVTIESKNIAKLEGSLSEDIMQFTSSNDSTYRSMNPFTQNRIHQFSIIDEYAKEYHRWPIVVPAVVLPDGCQVSAEIKTEPSLVFFSELGEQLAALAIGYKVPTHGAALCNLLEKWKGLNLRG